MQNQDASRLTAHQAAAKITEGSLTSEKLVSDLLARITLRDPKVHAWACLDAGKALAEARARDREPRRGPLHGIPIGIKDVIDTADMPTQYGAEAFKGFQPERDAACVTALRAAGLVILGKTVTAEFATYHPGPTTNPHDEKHTPGGSSSGSAAAVADFQVPLSIGTQTAGSIIRPASFCGVFGFKPTFGSCDVAGMAPTSKTLDTIGGFARSVEDLAALDHILRGHRGEGIFSPERPVRIGLCKSPVWDQAEPQMQALFETTAAKARSLGLDVMDIDLGPGFDRLPGHHLVIHQREAAELLGPIYDKRRDQLSDELGHFIAEGRKRSNAEYHAALKARTESQARFTEIFQNIDVMLNPAARGPAPEGLSTTGDPVFSRIWTMAGLPCINLPLGVGPGGLPLGIQAIGPYGGDRNLLTAAAWLAERL